MRRDPLDADLVELERQDRHADLGWPSAMPALSRGVDLDDTARWARVLVEAERLALSLPPGWSPSRAMGLCVCVQHEDGRLLWSALGAWELWDPVSRDKWQYRDFDGARQALLTTSR